LNNVINTSKDNIHPKNNIPLKKINKSNSISIPDSQTFNNNPTVPTSNKNGIKLNNKLNSITPESNRVTNNGSTLNETNKMVYAKKTPEKNKMKRCVTPEVRFSQMIDRMEKFEQAKVKRLEIQRNKKKIEFLNQFKPPEINENSKKMVSDTTFLDRMNRYDKYIKEKKKFLIDQKEEQIKSDLIPEDPKLIKVKGKRVNYIEYINNQTKWDNDRKLKIEALREQDRISEIKDCPFRPEINKNSMKLIQKMDQEKVVHRLYKDAEKRKNKIKPADDFNEKYEYTHNNLRLSFEDSKELVTCKKGQKNRNASVNHYMTNKHELIFESLFKEKLDFLKKGQLF